MPIIKESGKMSFQFLNLLYEKTGGDKFGCEIMWDIGSELGFERSVIQSITQYLESEGLIEDVTFGGEIAITHYGVKEVEKAISRPETATHYFPPVNIINIHHMEDSQIQQGSVSSNQAGAFKLGNGAEINNFLILSRQGLPKFSLSSEDESELKSDITTLESQIESSRPKPGTIKESLLSVQRILEGAAGGNMAQQLLTCIPALLVAFI